MEKNLSLNDHTPVAESTNAIPQLTPAELRQLIMNAPSSGAYCEEARRDALRQLEELEAEPTLTPNIFSGSSPTIPPDMSSGSFPTLPPDISPSPLQSLLLFWQEDYRAAVMDDNFARKHRLDDAIDEFLHRLHTATPPLPTEVMKEWLQRLESLQQEAESAFQNTLSPTLFDMEEKWCKTVEGWKNELASE